MVRSLPSRDARHDGRSASYNRCLRLVLRAISRVRQPRVRFWQRSASHTDQRYIGACTVNPPHDQPSINVFIGGAESKFKWLGTNVLTPEGKPFGGSSWIDVREYPLRGNNGDDGTHQRAHGVIVAGAYSPRVILCCSAASGAVWRLHLGHPEPFVPRR
jgi:hypothetical protein